MKFSVEFTYKQPPHYFTTIEAESSQQATDIALGKAKQRGFKSKPKNITVKEVN